MDMKNMLPKSYGMITVCLCLQLWRAMRCP